LTLDRLHQPLPVSTDIRCSRNESEQYKFGFQCLFWHACLAKAPSEAKHAQGKSDEAATLQLLLMMHPFFISSLIPSGVCGKHCKLPLGAARKTGNLQVALNCTSFIQVGKKAI
jgi:hypothetical protein